MNRRRALLITFTLMTFTGWGIVALVVLKDPANPGVWLAIGGNLGACGFALLGGAELLRIRDCNGVDAAYRLGCEVTRRSMLEELNRPATISPIRRDPDGLGAFNRRVALRSAGGRRGRPSPLATSRD